MIPPLFDYVAPKTLSEAVAVLEQDENSKVLAGGQSLIPLMRFRVQTLFRSRAAEIYSSGIFALSGVGQ